MTTQSDAPVFKDKTGTPLQPGDLIIYGHALGRCAALQYAKVLGIQWSKDTWGVPTPKVRVQGVDLDDNFNPNVPPKLQRISVLSFGPRTLKIPRESVEARTLALLDTVMITEEAKATPEPEES